MFIHRLSRRSGLRNIIGISLMALSCGGALAQNWPDRPIKMVIPFPPGGTSDVLGRFWAQKLGTALGTSVVVENRGGAGTTIAANLVVKAPPDGYTIYFTDVTTHAINATLYKNLAYHVEKDFTPVALVAASPLVLVVPGTLPVNTLADFIALVKSKPTEFNYASSGNGAILHLAGESLKRATGIQMTHIPYKGSAEAITATLGGQTVATFSTIPPAIPLVKSGKFKALGVTSTAPSEAFPGVPPIAQTVPNFNVVLYSGILGPAGMPPAVVQRINGEVSKILKEPETRKLYASFGAEPVDMSPADFGRQLSSLVESMGQAVRQSGASAE